MNSHLLMPGERVKVTDSGAPFPRPSSFWHGTLKKVRRDHVGRVYVMCPDWSSGGVLVAIREGHKHLKVERAQ